jgi:hypothetical protein
LSRRQGSGFWGFTGRQRNKGRRENVKCDEGRVLVGPRQINAGKGSGEAGSRTLVCVQPCNPSPNFGARVR